MDNFIEKFIYSPDNLSVVEFLSNYFIKILGYFLPVFVLVMGLIAIHSWFGVGAKREELRTMFVQISASLLIVSFLLYTEGRKEINSYSIQKSYWIVDTLNDVMVIGSRLADGFIYTLLLGNTYSSSNSPLFSFNKDHIFKLENYTKTPNGEDYVDGYFLNSLSGVIEQKKQETDAKNEVLINKAKGYMREDLAEDKQSVDAIKKFVDTEEFYQSGLLFFNSNRELEKNAQIIANEINELNADTENINGGLLELNAIQFKEKIINENTELFDLRTKKNLFNFAINEKRSVNANDGVDIVSKTKMAYNLPKFLLNSDIISLGVNRKEIDIDMIDSEHIRTTDIKNTLDKITDDSKFYDGYDNIIDFIGNSSKKDNGFNKRVKEIQNKYKEQIKSDYVLKKIYDNYTDKSGYGFVKNVKNGSATTQEYQRFLNFYFANLENTRQKEIFEIKEEIQVLEKSKADINAKNLDNFLILASENVVVDKNNQINLHIIGQQASKRLDVTENAIEQANKILGTITNEIYNNNIGKTSNANKGGSGVQLKYLNQDYIFLKDIEDTFSFFGVNLVKFSVVENGSNVKSFHWYDLGKYAVGLKNIYIGTNNFTSMISGFRGEVMGSQFLSTCLPVYKDIAINKDKSIAMSNSDYGYCFPQPQRTAKNGIMTLSSAVGSFYGFIIAQNVFSFGSDFIKNPLSFFVVILGSALIGASIGFLIFAVFYTGLMLLYMMIPVLFFYMTLMSWIFRSSIAMVFFGFSIVLFLFDHKKEQLQKATITFLMYSLFPIFISFVFILTINMNFIISATVDEIFPSIEDKSLVTTDLRKQELEYKNDIVKDNKKRETLKNAGNIERYFYKAYYKIIEIAKGAKDAVLTSIDKASITYSQGFKHTMLFVALDFIMGQIKFIVLVTLEIMIYMNLFKIDRFVNEMISTTTSSDTFAPEKLLSNFGLKV